MADSAQADVKQVDLSRALKWTGALVFADAFVLNQGAISAIVGLWMLFVSLPLILLVKGSKERGRRLARIAIFLGAVLLVFGLNWANNQIAKRRFETLITAIKAFKQEHQRYPAKLDELVPEFLDHVPLAKYTLAFPSFWYIALPDYHSLFYVEFPPFGRPSYTFEKDKRWYLD